MSSGEGVGDSSRRIAPGPLRFPCIKGGPKGTSGPPEWKKNDKQEGGRLFCTGLHNFFPRLCPSEYGYAILLESGVDSCTNRSREIWALYPLAASMAR